MLQWRDTGALPGFQPATTSLARMTKPNMARFLSQNWLVSRREMLRGAGVAMTLPMLDCMRPLCAADKPAAQPRRSVFIYMPNGVNTLDYQITTAGTDYEFSRSLKPLEKHRAKITPISGLHHPHGLGHHHNCSKIWLTGGKLGPSDRNTISVDQLMARVTAPHTRFPSMQLANKGGGSIMERGWHSIAGATKSERCVS